VSALVNGWIQWGIGLSTRVRPEGMCSKEGRITTAEETTSLTRDRLYDRQARSTKDQEYLSDAETSIRELIVEGRDEEASGAVREGSSEAGRGRSVWDGSGGAKREGMQSRREG
jgi:hypothetical protein